MSGGRHDMDSGVGSDQKRRRRGFRLIAVLAAVPVVLVAAASLFSFLLTLLFSEGDRPSVEAQEAGTVRLSGANPVDVRRIVLEAVYPVPVRESLEPHLSLQVILPRWVPQPDSVDKVRMLIVRESDGAVLGSDHQFFDDVNCLTPPCVAGYLVVFLLREEGQSPPTELDWLAEAALSYQSSSESDAEDASLVMAVEEVAVDHARLLLAGDLEEFTLNPSAPLQARHVVVRLGSDTVPEEGFNRWPVFSDLEDQPVTTNPNPRNPWFRGLIRRISDPSIAGSSPWSACQSGLPCEFGYTALIYYNSGPSHHDSSVESNPDNLQVSWRPGATLDYLDRLEAPPPGSATVTVDHVTHPGGFITHRVEGQVELVGTQGIHRRTVHITLEIPQVGPADIPVPVGALVTAHARRTDGATRTPPFFLGLGGDVMIFGGGQVISDGVTARLVAIPQSPCLPASRCTLTFGLNIRKDAQNDPDLLVDWSLDLHVGFFDTIQPPHGVVIYSEVAETVEP